MRAFQDAVRRRAVEREPVAYILGRRDFRRLELAVDRRALVPRPETELLVEVGLGLAAGARVLDLGTGSGAVALALKDERPDLRVSGSDISEAALELAELNARRLELDVQWLHADLLEEVGEFDAILSNPPYVADSERATLAPEIVRHEPPRRCSPAPTAWTRSAGCSRSWPSCPTCDSSRWRSAPDRRPRSPSWRARQASTRAASSATSPASSGW